MVMKYSISKYGGIFGIFTISFILISCFVSMAFFPGYNMINDMISHLGAGPSAQGRLIFNIGFIISGIMGIPHYRALGQTLSIENVNNKSCKWAQFVAFISCITFSLIGFFPTSLEGDWNAILIHGTVAFISVLSGLVYIVMFSSIMLKHSEVSNINAYYGYYLAVTYILFLFTWAPYWEWLLLLSYVSFIVLNSLFLLKQRISL